MAAKNQLSTFTFGEIALNQVTLLDGIPHITRQGMGEWLEYADPQNAIYKILERNPHIEAHSVVANLSTTDGKKYDINVYHPIGFLLTVMESGQPRAKEKKVEIAEFVWHFSNQKRKEVPIKDYIAIVKQITDTSKKLIESDNKYLHEQLTPVLQNLCDRAGLQMPDTALFKQKIDLPASDDSKKLT